MTILKKIYADTITCQVNFKNGLTPAKHYSLVYPGIMFNFHYSVLQLCKFRLGACGWLYLNYEWWM